MIKKKPPYHHGSLRAELMNQAMILLDEQGVDAVSIRQVARAAGVAHSAPVNHFKDKKSLLTALATEIFQHLVATIDHELKTGTRNLSESIHLFSNTVLEYGLTYPHRYKLLWRRDCLDNENKDLYAVMELIYRQLVQILSNNQHPTQISVESQAIALWSMIHGYVMMRLDGILIAKNDEVTGRERQSAIIDVLLNGIING